MSKIERLLKYESVMIRKDFTENIQLESNIDFDSLKKLKHWCSTEQQIRIIESKHTEKHIGLRLKVGVGGDNDNFAVFNMTINDFEKYFIGKGLVTTACGEAVGDFINGYKNLSYYGNTEYTGVKYDIMELLYDIENVDDIKELLYSIVGERFIMRTIKKEIVVNEPTTIFIDERGNLPVAEPLTNEDYIAIGRGIYEVVKEYNIKFFEK